MNPKSLGKITQKTGKDDTVRFTYEKAPEKGAEHEGYDQKRNSEGRLANKDYYGSMNPFRFFGTAFAERFVTNVIVFEGAVFVRPFEMGGSLGMKGVLVGADQMTRSEFNKSPMQPMVFDKSGLGDIPTRHSGFDFIDAIERQETGRFARLGNVQGDVMVRMSEGSWQPAAPNMILHEKDEIRTINGIAKILLDKGGSTAKLDLQEGSHLRFNSLQGENGETGEKKTHLDLAVGKVLVEVNKLQGGSEFEVKTPTSSAGVRGTIFEVVVEEKN
jgi:hypothetical protein